MARNLKNVTVTLDEETARWARLEAARQERSLSQFLGEMLRLHMEEGGRYQAARDRYVNQKPLVHRKRGMKYPARDELHER